MGRTVIIHTQTAKLGISDRFEQICLIDMASIASDGLSMNRDFEYMQPSCPSIDLAVGACLLDASGIVDLGRASARTRGRGKVGLSSRPSCSVINATAYSFGDFITRFSDGGAAL